MTAFAELSVVDWRRLNRLLEQALALDVGERATWLSHLPAADSDLQPVLKRLLNKAGLNETADFLPRPPRLVDPLELPATGAGSDDQPGDLVGPYRLVRQLGQGGMGTVWLAERADGAINRLIALKLPRAEWTDRGLVERMARERAALAALNHPNIAQLYDAGTAASGRPYLALEYVEGHSIDRWCDSQSLDLRARLRLFVEVVRAVAYAHAHLVVHRDLKPANVLVTLDGKVKLLDFGIAKILASESAAAEETALTRALGHALTLNYAAPEQILGRPVTIGSDVYSLGVMLFELTSAERPYRLPRGGSLPRGALENAIVHLEPPAPSSVAKDKLRARALRGDLDAIILKTLKKQPELRYETAAAFADDLQRFLDRRAVRAQRDSRWYRTRRFVARNKIALGTAGGVIVALASGLSVALWQARQAEEQADRARTINSFVLSIIQQADPATSAQTSAADLALLTAAEQRIARELSGRPDLQLQMRLAIATAYRNRGDFEKARQTLRAAFDEGRRHLPADNLDLLLARIRAIEWPLVDIANAQTELDAVIATLRGIGKRGVAVLVDALLARQTLRLATGSAEAALTDGKEAYVLSGQAYGPDDPRTLEAATAIAFNLAPWNLARRKDMLDAIEPLYQSAVEKKRIGASHPAMIEAKSAYGLALCQAGRPLEGMPLLHDAVALARTHHGPKSNTTEGALRTLAEALIQAGDLQQSIRVYREAHSLAAAREPLHSLYRSNLAYGLSWVLIGARRPNEARAIVEEAAVATESLPEGSLREGRALWHQYRFAHLYTALGEAKLAQPLLEELIPQAEKKQIGTLLTRLQWTLIKALLDNGDPVRAEALARQLFEQQRANNPGVDLGPFLVDLAQARLAQGAASDAVALADEAIASRRRYSTAWLPLDADLHLIRGRALLKLDRALQARESLAQSDAFWREFDAQNPWAAEAAYWYGHSLIATGETARGRHLVAQMWPRLAASWKPEHRKAAEPAANSVRHVAPRSSK